MTWWRGGISAIGRSLRRPSGSRQVVQVAAARDGAPTGPRRWRGRAAILGVTSLAALAAGSAFELNRNKGLRRTLTFWFVYEYPLLPSEFGIVWY